MRKALSKNSLVLLALVLCAAVASASDQTLTPTGKLRAALYPGTPTSILDPAESKPRGVGYELGQELARRLGVPYEPVVFSKNTEVLDAMRKGTADVAFTNASPARQKEMNFGPPFLIIESGYLVSATSPIASSADADRPGVRVGVVAGSTSDATLPGILKNATIVRAPTNQGGAEMLLTNQIDVFATNKATLFELLDKAPGTKILAGNWGEERHAIAFPHGREEAAATVKKFTEDALREGLVKAAMDRAALRGAHPADLP